MNIFNKFIITNGLMRLNVNYSYFIGPYFVRNKNLLFASPQLSRSLCTNIPNKKDSFVHNDEQKNNQEPPDTILHKTRQEQYFEYEKKLIDILAFRDKKKSRLLIYGGSASLVILYVSYESIKKYFSKQTAEAVTVTLQQDELIIETDKLAKQIVKSVLEDKNTFEFLQGIINDLTKDKEVQRFLREMLYEIYDDPEFQDKTKKFILAILTDKEFLNTVQIKVTEILMHSTDDIINDTKTKENVKKAIISIINNEEFLQESYASTLSVGKRLCTFGLVK